MPPGLITRRLQLRPSITATAGAARRTPRKKLLNGVNPESYWSANLTKRAVRSSRRRQVENLIARIGRKLLQHGDFFRQIHHDGGQVRLWVDSHSKSNYALELDPNDLKLLTAIGVTLVFDVYPYPQDW